MITRMYHISNWNKICYIGEGDHLCLDFTSAIGVRIPVGVVKFHNDKQYLH